MPEDAQPHERQDRELPHEEASGAPGTGTATSAAAPRKNSANRVCSVPISASTGPGTAAAAAGPSTGATASVAGRGASSGRP